ncbi:type-1 angiotensin II receptor-like isoform X2 [Convolutriloba macropyga]
MQLNTTLSAGISNSEDGEVQLGYQTQIRIAQVVTVAVTILGLVGNTLAYLTADHFPQKTSGQAFIKCLAVSDTVAGFQDGVMEALLAMMGVSFFSLHPMLCRFLGWFTYFSSSAAGFVLLATAFDRMIAISKPIWYQQNSTPHRAKITSISIWAVVGLSMLPNFFEYDLNGSYCNFVYDNSLGILNNLQFAIYYEVIFYGGFILPPVAMVFINIVIVYQLKRKSETVSRRDREVTISLVVVSLCFCLCLGGLGVLARLSLMLADSDPSLANLINYIRKLPAVINNSMNFYAYFLASRFFRETFFEVMGSHKFIQRCCCCCFCLCDRGQRRSSQLSQRQNSTCQIPIAGYKKSAVTTMAL